MNEVRQPKRPARNRGLYDPVQLQDRLFVKDNRIDLVDGPKTTCFQAILDGLLGEFIRMLAATKPLFQSRRNDAAIANQRCCTVMKKKAQP